jgi:hypothetical protein
MSPQPRVLRSLCTPLVASGIATLLLVGCGGGGSSSDNKDAWTPTPDVAAKKDSAPSTGGTVGTPDAYASPDVWIAGGAGGSVDSGSGTGGVGGAGGAGGAKVDGGPDTYIQAVDGGHPDTPILPDGSSDTTIAPDTLGAEVKTVGSDSGGEAGQTLACQTPTMAKSSTVPGLLTVAWDKNNAIVTGGYFQSATTDFLGKAVTNQGSADMFVAGINPATGAATWIFTAGDNLDQYVTQVAVSSGGIVGAIGNFTGGLEVLTGTQITNPSSKAIDFIAGIDGSTGAGVWAKSANLGLPSSGSSSFGRLNAIAGNPNKDYFVVCGSATNAASQLVTGATNGGGKDVVVAAVKAADGTVLWSKLLGGASDQSCTAAALDDSGNVFLAGQYAGALDLGTGALSPAPTGATDQILWVAKLDGATGNALAAQAFGTTGHVVANAVTTDAQGNVIVGGQFSTAFAVGTTQLAPIGSNDAFVIKLSTSLSPTWARRWGGTGQGATCTGVAATSAGNIVAVGAFKGTADVGPGSTVVTANAPTGTDVLIASLDGTTGATTCAHNYGDSAATAGQGANRVAVNRWASDGTAVVGTFVGTINFGQAGTTLAGGGASNPYAFVLTTSP